MLENIQTVLDFVDIPFWEKIFHRERILISFVAMESVDETTSR